MRSREALKRQVARTLELVSAIQPEQEGAIPYKGPFPTDVSVFDLPLFSGEEQAQLRAFFLELRANYGETATLQQLTDEELSQLATWQEREEGRKQPGIDRDRNGR